MFKILDGRESFYQWDLDRKIIVEDDSITQVHFCNRTDECSLVVETYKEDGKTVANVPNILLQSDWRINVYAYDKNYTKFSKCFDIVKRTKPEGYVYTETEVLNYNTLYEKLEDIENNIGEVVSDYLEENPIVVDLSAYYNKEETDAAIEAAVGAIEIPDAPDVDLSDYYTKKETDDAIESAIANIDIPEGGGGSAESIEEIYIGTDAPENPDAVIWIDPEAEGAEYALKSDIPEMPDLEQYVKIEDVPYGMSDDVELLRYQDFSFDEELGFFYLARYVELIEGETYTVCWNGKYYETVAVTAYFEGEELVILGNPAALGGEDNGLPFAVGCAQGLTAAIPLDGSGIVSLGITGYGFKPLPEELLPEYRKSIVVDAVPTGEDWGEIETTGSMRLAIASPNYTCADINWLVWKGVNVVIRTWGNYYYLAFNEYPTGCKFIRHPETIGAGAYIWLNDAGLALNAMKLDDNIATKDDVSEMITAALGAIGIAEEGAY